MDADDSAGGSSGAGACPDVEIEINTDDLVLLQHRVSTMNPVTPCRLRAKSKKSGSFTVVLTNPDGRLHFTGDKNTLTVNVPGGGVWADFEITGVKGSNKLADAIIQAHCGTDTGPLVETKAVTVVWFDASMAVKPEGIYSVDGNDFEAAGQAVTLAAKAEVRPKGVNCSAPQIVDLRIGIIQNSLPFSASGKRTRTASYGSPEVYWLPGVPIGKQVQVPAQWQLNFENSSVSNDSSDGSDPLYDLPKRAKAKGTLDFGKDLAKPRDCGAGTTESRDNPGTFLGSGAHIWVRVSDGSGKGSAPAKEPVRDDMGWPIKADGDPAVIGGKGETLGWVKYTVVKATLQQSFMDWAVIINKTTKEFIGLRQRGWSLDVDSGSGKRASADSVDKDATETPVTKRAFSNDINNDPKNWKTGPVPGNMVPMTKDAKSKTTDDSLAMPAGIP